MKERISSALNSSNLAQKESNCALDIVHSLGIAAMSNPIGVSSMHFKDGLQPKEYQSLIYELSRKAGKQIKCDKRTLLNVCKQVVYEDAFSFCWTCYGRKEAIIDKKVHRCDVCAGTGLKKHTDHERAKGIGVSDEIFTKHWVKRYQLVQSIYTSQQKDSLRVVKERIYE